MVTKLSFVVENRQTWLRDPVPDNVFTILKQQGFEIVVLSAEDHNPHLPHSHDTLYILKSQSDNTLHLASQLHAQHARTLNPYPACIAIYDKMAASAYMEQLAIPTPKTWESSGNCLYEISQQHSVIIKPIVGGYGTKKHIRIVDNPHALDKLKLPNCPVYFQENLVGDGTELKVYVIGKHVFASRRARDLSDSPPAGYPHPVSSYVRDAVLRCGQAFGLTLYGVDIIESQGRPLIIDVNAFPSYRGVANAGRLIAEHIAEVARR
jgi:ribosomal protein S6--L-glutamate ligase